MEAYKLKCGCVVSNLGIKYSFKCGKDARAIDAIKPKDQTKALERAIKKELGGHARKDQ